MLIPATRYSDCETALKFLMDVLEMTPHAVIRDEAGAIQHAQLCVGRGLMMFGPQADTGFGAFMVSPRETGMRETTTIYVIIGDVAGLYGRVLDRGAEIVMPLAAQDYGGSSFSVRDPEGHVFTFGDYDPFAS